MPERDAERSREAILAAAEDLFARDGYEGASMERIGEAAGVARSTPAYFFASKENLYRTVLDRLFERANTVLAPAHEAAARNAGRPREAIESLVGAYLDFLAADVNFVRVIHRETATSRDWLRETLENAPVVQAAMRALPSALGADRPDPATAAYLVVNVSALVWYPFAQAHTLLAALGIDPRDESFLEAQKRYITNILLAAAAANARTTGATA
jgi:TetR/AcrR family transcriptional regulator